MSQYGCVWARSDFHPEAEPCALFFGVYLVPGLGGTPDEIVCLWLYHVDILQTGLGLKKKKKIHRKRSKLAVVEY